MEPVLRKRSIDDLPEYYVNLGSSEINSAIRNFDNADNLDYFNAAVTSATSRNFLLDFGDEEAWCAFNLEAMHYSKLLTNTRPVSLNTRWINIWSANEQKELLTTLAKHYDFNPRLLGLMCSNPVGVSQKSTISSKLSLRASHVKASIRDSILNISGSSHGSKKSSCRESTSPDSSINIEDGLKIEDLAGTHEPDMTRTLNQYALASDIWHYSTMDWGRQYMCVGYNTLHMTEAVSGNNVFDESQEDLPSCKRLWNWLILCEDKTVIMIHEDPYPSPNGPISHRQKRNLGIIRRNLINIFRQCSKARDTLNEITALQLPLRTRIGDSDKETQHRASDVPGLLFYHLFDDWLSIYSLIARRDNRYALELDDLRRKMLVKAELRHVERLHHLGRQLAVLKRLYAAYDLMIDRLLGKREVSLASLQNSNIIYSGLQAVDSSHFQIGMTQSDIALGVSLSSAARIRFERLKHRMQLYAMDQVSECLEQKESLVMMNFNLLAIKESFSVERLTVVTLLLAKVTILFMPVSLMTAIFSCQFDDMQFSYKSFWKWFAGVFSMSALCIIVFSFLSGTTEGKIITKPMGRRLLDFSGDLLSARRKKKILDKLEEE